VVLEGGECGAGVHPIGDVVRGASVALHEVVDGGGDLGANLADGTQQYVDICLTK